VALEESIAVILLLYGTQGSGANRKTTSKQRIWEASGRMAAAMHDHAREVAEHKLLIGLSGIPMDRLQGWVRLPMTFEVAQNPSSPTNRLVLPFLSSISWSTTRTLKGSIRPT
jgi:hypothetical protein